ncbi:hypothetical protein IKA92_06585 [bacterium]|nr:hypothetical protein [bacterium]
MIQGTSNMLMQHGIMPYDANAYLFGTPSPYVGYPVQGHAYAQPFVMPQDTYVAPAKKKHTLAKVLLAGGAVAGAVVAIKNPEKAKAVYDKAVEKGKKGFEFVKEKSGTVLEFVKEKGGKFIQDVKAGAVKLYNKIFKKG